MYSLRYTKQYERDLKLVLRQGRDRKKIDEVISLLRTGEKLPDKYQDHSLNDSKHYKNKRDCHIQSDWILIYEIKKDELVLELTRTGSHSDLFR
ncbi:MAG: type II toxin-antitoxin system YafQ family toxin [Erysipelotrichaceae bacterium]|nr:type II toxin-antitoxin system YafQ family toxin [Erysipelotrichaceae bacterium]